MRVLKIGISLPKAKLYQNIDRRVDTRINRGMAAEVQRLHEQGLSWKKLDDFGLEYRWLSRYLRRQMDRTAAVEKLKTDIHHFAKRQMTWWKRDREILWVVNRGQAQQLVKKFLT